MAKDALRDWCKLHWTSSYPTGRVHNVRMQLFIGGWWSRGLVDRLTIRRR